MKKVVVIGMGRFGHAVCIELTKLGIEVLAVDSDESAVNEIVDHVTHALIMDATNREALADAGIMNFKTAIVGIGHNVEASILTTLMLKEIGVENVTARAINRYHGLILEKIGADRIIYPEAEMGRKLARSITNPDLIDFLDFGESFSIVEVLASENMIGKTLRELQLRNRFGINVVAVKRGGRINGAPGADDALKNGDELLVSGPPENISKIKKA
ncbi:MAG: TrkA family potassium uptake protein [bacterium]